MSPVNWAILAIDAPAPAMAPDFGSAPNVLWPDPSAEIARHRAHVLIVSPSDPTGRNDALAKARAVTLAAAAYSKIAPTLGIVWVDAGNLLPAATFQQAAAKLTSSSGNAVPVWVRVMLAQDAKGRVIVGTAGLSAFGLQDIEYSPVRTDFAATGSHALATVEYLLQSGASLSDGQTIGVSGERTYRITKKLRGTFSDEAVLLLQ